MKDTGSYTIITFASNNYCLLKKPYTPSNMSQKHITTSYEVKYFHDFTLMEASTPQNFGCETFERLSSLFSDPAILSFSLPYFIPDPKITSHWRVCSCKQNKLIQYLPRRKMTFNEKVNGGFYGFCFIFAFRFADSQCLGWSFCRNRCSLSFTRRS